MLCYNRIIKRKANKTWLLHLILVLVGMVKHSTESKGEIRMNNTQKNYETLSKAIKTNNISVEELLDAFTNWHGLQLLDDDFMEFLEEEGIIY